MSETVIVRARFSVDDRTFSVLAEPWFDDATGEWFGRYLYLPLDRSLPRIVSTGPIRRSKRRDEVLEQLGTIGDRDLARAFRAIALPLEKRPRGR
ncbi:MAG: hypothetical protein M3068_04120 [Gemmatimonadota bacterium]|nr:hypothetical protein [Gemmatimonadota bacterium]